MCDPGFTGVTGLSPKRDSKIPERPLGDDIRCILHFEKKRHGVGYYIYIYTFILFPMQKSMLIVSVINVRQEACGATSFSRSTCNGWHIIACQMHIAKTCKWICTKYMRSYTPHVCMFINIYVVYIHIFIYTYIYTHIYTYSYIHIYIYTYKKV